MILPFLGKINKKKRKEKALKLDENISHLKILGYECEQ